MTAAILVRNAIRSSTGQMKSHTVRLAEDNNDFLVFTPFSSLDAGTRRRDEATALVSSGPALRGPVNEGPRWPRSASLLRYSEPVSYTHLTLPTIYSV